MDLVKRKHLMC